MWDLTTELLCIFTGLEGSRQCSKSQDGVIESEAAALSAENLPSSLKKGELMERAGRVSFARSL